MEIKKLKKKFLNYIGKKFSKNIIKILCGSIKIKEINRKVIEDLERVNQNFILAFWHGKMLIPWYLFRETNSSTIISKSKDGNILANILESWKYDVKRGSSSKGGKEVLDDLIVEANKGKNILITPDGPRGPICKMKAGTIVVAKKSKIPIILIGISNKSRTRLNSWDKFEIPWFFSSTKVKYSNPYYINEDLTYDQTDEKIKFIESELIKLESEVEKIC